MSHSVCFRHDFIAFFFFFCSSNIVRLLKRLHRWKRTGNLCTCSLHRTPPTTCTRDTCTTWPAGKCTAPCPVERLRRNPSARTLWASGRHVCTPDGANACTGTASLTPHLSHIFPSTTSRWSHRNTSFRSRRCWTLERWTVVGYSLACRNLPPKTIRSSMIRHKIPPRKPLVCCAVQQLNIFNSVWY